MEKKTYKSVNELIDKEMYQEDLSESDLLQRGVISQDCKEVRGLLGLALYVGRNRLLDITNEEYDEAFKKIEEYLNRVGWIETGI